MLQETPLKASQNDTEGVMKILLDSQSMLLYVLTHGQHYQENHPRQTLLLCP